jgi:hypothetical protein
VQWIYLYYFCFRHGGQHLLNSVYSADNRPATKLKGSVSNYHVVRIVLKEVSLRMWMEPVPVTVYLICWIFWVFYVNMYDGKSLWLHSCTHVDCYTYAGRGSALLFSMCSCGSCLPVPCNDLCYLWKRASSFFTSKLCSIFRFTDSAGCCFNTSCTVLFMEPLVRSTQSELLNLA